MIIDKVNLETMLKHKHDWLRGQIWQGFPYLTKLFGKLVYTLSAYLRTLGSIPEGVMIIDLLV